MWNHSNITIFGIFIPGNHLMLLGLNLTIYRRLKIGWGLRLWLFTGGLFEEKKRVSRGGEDAVAPVLLPCHSH